MRVWGGGAYINALFLTCPACFRLALNECAENTALWLFRSGTARRAGFLSLSNLILDSWQQPFSFQWDMRRQSSLLLRERAVCVSFYILI